MKQLKIFFITVLTFYFTGSLLHAIPFASVNNVSPTPFSISLNPNVARAQPTPDRDFGDDWIIYDDGRPPWFFYAREDYWSRQWFTPHSEFELQAVSFLAWNPHESESPCNVYVYSENQDTHDLIERLWAGRIDIIPPFDLDHPEDMWITIELDEEDYILFEEGENFSIIYGPAPGGHDWEEDGWWNLFDRSTEVDRSSVCAGDLQDEHDQWDVLNGDLMLRANGEYVGVDVAVENLYSSPGQWIISPGSEMSYTALIANPGCDVENVEVNFFVLDEDGNEISELGMTEIDGMESEEEIEIEIEERWQPEEIGYYTVQVVVDVEDDVFEDNNVMMLEQIVVNPEVDPDMWIGYCRDEPSLLMEGHEDNGWITAFSHPGGDQYICITGFRHYLVNFGDDPVECRFVIGRHFVEFNWTDWLVEFNVEIEAESEGWVEVERDDDWWAASPMLGVDIWVACYNQGLALGLDAIPPVSANNPEMPATMYITTDGGRRFEEFHQSDYMCQATYSIRERGCLLTIEPETLDFGDDLIVGREYSIEALFSSFGDDTVAIHAIQMPMNAEDYLSVEPTEFVIPPDEEVIVTVTFSTEEPVELVSRLRVLNNSDNIDNAFIWDVYATASEEQPEGRQLRIEPELLDFGDNLSPGEEYTINAVFSSFGDETVTINRIRISGDGEDYLTVDPTEFEIEPGSEQVVTVIFRSDEPGEYNLRILVVNDSQNMDNVFQWDVIAVVIDEVPEGRHLSIEPDALDFGDSLEIDQEYSIEAVFSSFGDEAVTITEIIPPDNAADYLTIDPNGEFVLEPDSDRIVIVTFASEEPVELDIDLRVMHNAENIHQPCLWHLSAAIPEEVPRGLRYRPESLNFGNDLRPGREYIIVAIFTTYDEMVRVRAITIPQEYRDCLSVEPSSFVIEAEDIMEVTVTFRSDEPVVLDSSLFIISDADNLPENQPWPIRAVCSEGVPEGPHLRIEPDPLEFGDDLLIGLEYSIDAVFTSFGDETVTIWDIQIPHAGRNCLTVEPDQLEIPPGEERTVTVTFDSDEAVEIDSHMRIINNAVNLADVYLWHVSAVSSGEDYEVTVPMLDRWNLISINVVPPDSLWLRREGPDVILMTERLRDEEDNHRLFLIKDEEGQFYIPEYGYCSIPYWDLTEGFLVNVLEDVEPSWNGIQIPPSTDIPLEEGWNMVAYFPTYELDANRPDYYVLSNILDHLIIAKNGAGNFMYPGHNFSNMPPWREGQGYKINVDSDVVLNYPRQQDENAVTIPQLRDEHSGVTVTPYNMSVLLIDVSGIGYVEGRTVRAFRADGFKVGEGEMDIDSRCGLAVYGDDPETDYIEGLSEGELFELRLYDQLSCVDAILKPGMFIRGKKLVYENDGILVMEAEIQAVVPDKFDLFTNYPNPFNSSTRLDFILKEKADVRLSVWDTSGRMLNVIINGRLDAGSQCATWSVHDMPSGIYVFLLEVNGGRYVTKGVLIR